jgi:hypothetical protein
VPVSRGLKTTAADMLRSLLVILGAVGLLILLVPRPTSVPRPTVDLAATSAQARAELGFDVAVPVPPGWTATSARIRRDTGDIPSWTINYLTDQGRYVGLVQAAGWNARWQSSLTHGGTAQDPLTISGVTWQVHLKPERELTSLIRREGGRTTLILAKSGGRDDALVLARLLPPGS